MAVNFDLLKNTFRPAEPSYLNLKIGQLEPLNQKELANLAEFVRMIGKSSKFAMKAHYELSGKNSNSSSCKVEEISDETLNQVEQMYDPTWEELTS